MEFCYHFFCVSQDLLKKIDNFQEDARDALQDAIPNSEKLQNLLDVGAGLDIDLPEVPKLKQASWNWFVEMYPLQIQ